MKAISATQDYLWQALRLFNLYRLFLSLGFLSIAYFHFDVNFFGQYNEPLFESASKGYFLISLMLLVVSTTFKDNYSLQANLPPFIDVFAILILMHASGGFVSGVGILLIVIVAAHSLLMPGRLSTLTAAIATLGIFFEHTFSLLQDNSSILLYPQVAFLGAAILTTSLVTNLLSVRTRRSQRLLETQALQLATSQQLNAYIVSEMDAGVLVLDNQHHIRLVNTASSILLNLDATHPTMTLDDLPRNFQDAFIDWQHHGKPHQTLQSLNQEVRLSFHPLGKDLPSGTLVFINNAAEEARRAQDLKLASLGHLTANIAHELRNPLGAASHAAQLLAETRTRAQEDDALITMIKQSCDRMNTVIQNVLSLSNRNPPKAQSIVLSTWLQSYVQDVHFSQTREPDIHLEIDNNTLSICIDPSQLTQILNNLCENGLRYSLRDSNTPYLLLRVITQPPTTVILEVIDKGEGIPAETLKHLFEPFFTTEKSGTGLGLYIAKELAQLNGARLNYISSNEGGHFRLTFLGGAQG